jgi:hypothetical protein
MLQVYFIILIRRSSSIIQRSLGSGSSAERSSNSPSLVHWSTRPDQQPRGHGLAVFMLFVTCFTLRRLLSSGMARREDQPRLSTHDCWHADEQGCPLCCPVCR